MSDPVPCPDCGQDWDPGRDPRCPVCGLSVEDLEAAAAFMADLSDRARPHEEYDHALDEGPA